VKGKKKPEPIAVALFYDGRNAPRVTAKGEGELARRIQAEAERHGVPLYEDAILASVLAQLDLGDEIPRNLYVAVAEVIAFTYLLSGKVTGVPLAATGPALPPPGEEAGNRDREGEKEGG